MRKGIVYSRTEEKLRLLKHDGTNEKLIRGKVKEFYEAEYEDLLFDIMNLDSKRFLQTLTTKVMDLITNEYTEVALNNHNIIDSCKQNESFFQQSKYKNDYCATKAGWQVFEGNLSAPPKLVQTAQFLENFIPHCSKTDKTPLHTCGYKLIVVKGESDSALYIICVGCKFVYRHNSIKLICTACNLSYYTKYLTKLEREEEYVAATWEKYHCNNIINDYMHCLKCKEMFYYGTKTRLLRCLKCNYQVKPSNVEWICLICKLEFKSEVKQYHPIEFKIVKDAIKDALFKKVLAKPSSIPCCKTANTKEIFHKKECIGILYSGNLFNKVIIACEKCRMMNYLDNFTWTCPVCFKKFRPKISKTARTDSNVPTDFIRISSFNNFIIQNQIVRTRNNVKLDTAPDSAQHYNTHNNYFNQDTSIGSIEEDKKEPAIAIISRKEGNGSLSGRLPAFKPKNLIDILDNRKGRTSRKNTSGDNESTISISAFTSSFDSLDKSTPSLKNINSPQKEPAKKVGFELKLNLNQIKKSTEPEKTAGKESLVSNLSNKYSITEEFNMLDSNPISSDVRNKAMKIVMKVLEEDKSMNEYSGLSHRKVYFESREEKHQASELKQTHPHPDSKWINVDDYKVIQQIGEGTYGKIYKVVDSKNKMFALKKLICHDKEELKLTKREYNIMECNYHSNIVKIEGMSEKELDQTTLALYILLELADNDWEGEVTKRYKQQKFYSEIELVSILYQISSCLSFLQEKKISHRDIKPQNILVFHGSIYKVADFGEAKQNTTLRQKNTVRGTELYMSPLLFQMVKLENSGNKKDSQDVVHNLYKSDVFSLGYCIIYAGSLTFDSISKLREIEDPIETEFVIRSYFKKKYTDKFIKLILKMIDPDESKRYDFIELNRYLKKY